MKHDVPDVLLASLLADHLGHGKYEPVANKIWATARAGVAIATTMPWPRALSSCSSGSASAARSTWAGRRHGGMSWLHKMFYNPKRQHG